MEPMSSSEIHRREELADLCNYKGLLGTAVEVGVDRGQYSAEFLKRWDGENYIGVDPWDNEYDYGLFIDCDRNEDYQIAKSNLEMHKGDKNLELIQLPSIEAVIQVDDNLDFVYLDGNHHYSEVVTDLKLWYPKIKSGGILAGHDFSGDWINQVRTAVIEFAYVKQLQIYYVLGNAASWYCYKP